MIVHGKLVSVPSGCWDTTTVWQNVLSRRTRASANGMWCAPEEGPYGKISVQKNMQSICAQT